LDINTDSEPKANYIKANIDGFLKKNLFPLIETLFDEYAPYYEFKRFDSIDLDLKIDSVTYFDEIKKQLVSQLQTKLKEAEFESSINTKFRSEQDFGIKHLDKTWKENSTGNSQRIEIKMPKMITVDMLTNMENIFLYFLSFGQLPWYATPLILQEFIQFGGFNSSIYNEYFIQKLLNLFSTNKSALIRFIQQFDNEIIETLIVQLLENRNINCSEFLLFISDQNQQIKEFLYELIIESMIQVDFQISTNLQIKLYKKIVEVSKSDKLVNKRIKQVQEILNIFIPNASSMKFLNEVLNTPKTMSQPFDVQISSDGGIKSDNQIHDFNELESVQQNGAIFNQPEEGKNRFYERIGILPIIPGNVSKTYIELKTEYVQNAGLILAHPFLGSLFSRTHCNDEKNNLLPEKKPLAVHILHYLATGKEQDMEYNQTFEKFLCGVPFDYPIPRKIELSNQQIIECNDLLKTVISYWPALKNTSPDGLRQMFFQRDGKLIQQEKSFKLIVERKAQDALLEKITWNLSIAKLQWINEILFIEW
jgi:hypothetical protein